MSNLEKLVTYFEQFPGIGARQARRFAFHILTLPEDTTTELAELITNLKQTVTTCHSCYRFFAQNGGHAIECSICSNQSRNRKKLLIVATDSDIQAIEKTDQYDGLYFVLGGTIPLLHERTNEKIRSGALKAIVNKRLEEGLHEIILGFAVNPDGENTARFVDQQIAPLIDEFPCTVTTLGRGLSTGSELEYADPETIRNALTNRTEQPL